MRLLIAVAVSLVTLAFAAASPVRAADLATSHPSTVRPDGLFVDGRPYLDNAGRIVDSAVDEAGGRAYYIVDLGGGSAALKRLDLASLGEATTVGSLVRTRDGVQFATERGLRTAALHVRATTHGAAFFRDASLVLFDEAKGLSSYAVPPGVYLAEYQNGDIAGTRHVLVRRYTAEARPQALMRDTVEIGRELIGRRDPSFDFALLSLDTGNLLPLNIRASRNETGFAYGCIPHDTLTRECLGWVGYEAIFDPDGRPNWSHYFWSLTWRRSIYGPVAVVMEDGLKEVNAVLLLDGSRHTVFRRWAGIQYFAVEPSSTGDLSIDATWGFRVHSRKLSDALKAH